MDIKHHLQVWLALWLYIIGITAKACICSALTSAFDEAPLLSSLLAKHSSQHNPEFQHLLSQEFSKQNSCDNLLFNASNTFSLSILKRHIVGEGSHRSLVSSLRFDIDSNGMLLLDSHFCNAVLVESLPRGVFADSFELQHLVRRAVFHDISVFGDTNLELPSALSNQSTVVLYLDVRHSSLTELQEGLQVTSELPLHARYPPLETSGYSTVEINPPDVMMLYKPKVSQDDCSSVIISWNASARCAQKVVWEVPSGNQAHSGIVSVVTFVSALLSALVIVYAAVFCSLPNNVID